MDKRDLHIRLPEDLAAALDVEQQRLGLSLNATIITALRQWQASKENS